MKTNFFKNLYFVPLMVIIAIGHTNAGEKIANEITSDDINYDGDILKGVRQRLDSLRLGNMHLTIDGSCDCGDIDRQIEKKLPGLRQIYNQRLRVKNNLTGWIGFHFDIDNHGNVLKCGINESTVDDKTLNDSLRYVINGWKFKPQKNITDTTHVYLPFYCGSSFGTHGISCNGKLIEHHQ